jgi:hypothetical protein
MNLKKIIVLALFIAQGLSAFSQIVDDDYKNNQPKENSPFSRFGLGNVTPQYLIGNGSMGGLTAAYRDPFAYNPQNPASLSSLRASAFEIGIYAKSNTIKEASNTSQSWSGNINHVALAFPTYSVINEVLDRKPRQVRWGMGFALTPFNTVGYNIATSSKAPNTDTVSVTNFYIGSGGSYRFMWGNGVSYKGLSAGVNLGYIFGKMNYTRQTVLGSNLILPYANNFSENYNITGLTWNAGLQYDITLDPVSKYGEKGGRKHIVIGAYGNPSTSFNTNKNVTYKRTVVGYDSVTVDGQYDILGKGKLPSEFTFGVAYEHSMKLKVGAEYSSSKWSQYKNDARSETLKDATQLAIGAEFILNKSKLSNEEEKIRWRVGFRTGKDPRSLLNEQLTTQSYSAGMCLPLRVGRGSQISYLNFGLEYGQIGTPRLKENYVKISAGFTLNDNSWFLKRKFQ